jgi:protein-tyrosine phosphatase
MNLFHEVDLTNSLANGRLFLHSMPGRFEPLSDFVTAMETEDISRILCLVSDAEIRQKSPGYFDMLKNDRFRQRVLQFPIQDFGVVEDVPAFRSAMNTLAGDLRAGRNVLIHCAAGVGRTGTAANCLLANLGFDSKEAEHRVSNAHAGPETDEQREFVDGFFVDSKRSNHG